MRSASTLAARGDRFAVAWLLIAKPPLPLLPFQALALGARPACRTTRRLPPRRRPTAAWLALDVWLQSHYGAHLTNYLPFIGSALRSLEQVQWVGDPVALAVALAKLFARPRSCARAARARGDGDTRRVRAARAAAGTRSRRRRLLRLSRDRARGVPGAAPARGTRAAQASGDEPPIRHRLVVLARGGARFARPASARAVPWPWRSAELTEVMIHNPARTRARRGCTENASGSARRCTAIAAGATRH
jgi:hypothetical protein